MATRRRSASAGTGCITKRLLGMMALAGANKAKG
jgi:hypothetical protein